jgi:hypothetical protein
MTTQQHFVATALDEGVVRGAPRRWLRLEGATLLVASLIGFSATHEKWWLFPIFVLVPDIAMLGYVRSTRAGAAIYNLAHVTLLPAVLLSLGWGLRSAPLAAIGLIWIAHVGLDRLLGYGLKYDDHFQHTHLGRLGRN